MPKKKPLTDKDCSNAKPKEKPWKLSDSGGLYLETRPSGGKLWMWKYYYFGKEKRLSIGQYPQVGLKDARRARDKARDLLDSGKDPSFEKQEQRRVAAATAANTFELFAREWHEKNKAGWSENHANTVLRRLEFDVFPSIGKLPITDISSPRIVMVLETIEKRKAHDVAKRVLQYCRAIFAYAKIRGMITSNPADMKAKDVLTPVESKSFAAIGAKDLPIFLSKLHRNEAHLFYQTQLAMEFMMLTFTRTSEMIQAQWSEFDLQKKEWTVPASRMKMRTEHIVPLSRQAIAIFEKLRIQNGHTPWVFASQRNPGNHISNGTLLMALDRMGYRGEMTGHGFRALAMTTIMEELHYRPEVPDLQLAHSKGDKTRRAYDRTTFLAERHTMMQDWADYLDKLATNGDVILGRFEEADLMSA